ncbi:MAG: 7-carboxy-7-deazaguanine synthase QueE, partial [Thermodesulfovibrionales bacterium]|nr:7-carboxy-7-deazaguanine synthase QueE [Thermodesulfovibrionales bacterium]
EPLEQEETPVLLKALLDKGFKKKVLVETNGSKDISVLDPRAIVIMDIKTPGSGEAGSFDLHNIARLKPSDEVKFVLTSREDYEWARSFLQEHDVLLKSEVLFSPAFGSLEPRTLAGWILDDALTVRLNLQLHKYIFKPDERGV